MKNFIVIKVSKKQYKEFEKLKNLLNEIYNYVDSQTNDLVGEYNRIFKNLEDHIHMSMDIIEINYFDKNYGLTFSSNRWKNCFGEQIFIPMSCKSRKHLLTYTLTFHIEKSKGQCSITSLITEMLQKFFDYAHIKTLYETINKNYLKVVKDEGLKEFGMYLSDVNKNYYMKYKYEITQDILDFVIENSSYTEDEINQLSDKDIYKLYTDLQKDFYGD